MYGMVNLYQRRLPEVGGCSTCSQTILPVQAASGLKQDHYAEPLADKFPAGTPISGTWGSKTEF